MDPYPQATARISRFKSSLTTNKWALSTKDISRCSQVQQGRGVPGWVTRISNPGTTTGHEMEQ